MFSRRTHIPHQLIIPSTLIIYLWTYRAIILTFHFSSPLCRLRNPRCLNCPQRVLYSRSLHCLVVLPRHHLRRSLCFRPQVPPNRLVNLGRIYLYLPGSLHRRHRRNNPRPPRRRSPNRRLRTRILCDRPPNLRSRHCGFSNNLRFFRRNISLPASHQRDAPAKGLQQGPVHLHGHRPSSIPLVLARSLQMVRPMGRLSILGICRPNH